MFSMFIMFANTEQNLHETVVFGNRKRDVLDEKDGEANNKIFM